MVISVLDYKINSQVWQLKPAGGNLNLLTAFAYRPITMHTHALAIAALTDTLFKVMKLKAIMHNLYFL